MRLASTPPMWYCLFWSTVFVLYCLFWLWHDR